MTETQQITYTNMVTLIKIVYYATQFIYNIKNSPKKDYKYTLYLELNSFIVDVGAICIWEKHK